MDSLLLTAIGITAVICFVMGAAIMYAICHQDEKEFNALQADYQELQDKYFQLRSRHQ